MKHTTKRSITQLQRWHSLVVLSLVVLSLLGQMPDSQAGWLTSPRSRQACLPSLFGGKDSVLPLLSTPGCAGWGNT